MKNLALLLITNCCWLYFFNNLIDLPQAYNLLGYMLLAYFDTDN